MELPAALRRAVDDALQGEPLDRLTRASQTLSDRYRREVRDGRFHIDGALAAKAYLTTRLPATFAAVRAALDMVAEASSTFAPQTLLDIGAGPGTALWAAADCWPELHQATIVEASASIRTVGEALARSSTVASTWLAGDVTGALPVTAPADLVTLAYVLDEIAEGAIADVTGKLWALTGQTLVIVEPGTPAGWRRIQIVRDTLIKAGAHLVAPCPHAAPCAIAGSDWCHFSRRVARSRLHRLAKQADVPWEDEKYIFIAASRTPAEPPPARILAPPRVASGLVGLKLCRSDGGIGELVVSRRDGDLFREARRADWADGFHLPQDEDSVEDDGHDGA
ncbi:small ribosomal subunit Rsm22 family protein [Ciceribacter sp. RN22]|uniref:small ribosomal subunit Rsm22 family protein n=1 Tax=Ciceribacter sp. RN22 TaxID=2954932 RepID=UPI0020931723|nr:small ribosomal subunit Rsm22 family protein [Ciceribacter sp. RN22]MCO6177803.1 methyltransferase type 11 [Ciceribacter sp. RN22]